MISNKKNDFLLKKRPLTEKLADKGFKIFSLLMASSLSILLLAIFVVIFYESLDSMNRYGIDFLITSEWNPVTDKYGAFTAIYGTLITSLVFSLY